MSHWPLAAFGPSTFYRIVYRREKRVEILGSATHAITARIAAASRAGGDPQSGEKRLTVVTKR